VLELGDFLKFHVGMQLFDDRLSLLPQVLSKIPKAALTTIKFDFWIQNPPYSTWQINYVELEETNADATWMAIDKLLAGSSFPVLTEVVFTVSRSLHVFEVAPYLELRLARCKERGLLHISKAIV
jgi:hypothetical protein